MRISVRQPAAKPLQKVPPPVKAKPAKVYPPSIAEVKTPTDEFPPPPPPEVMEKPAKSSVEDELDALTSMLALGLESTDDPDFYGKLSKWN